MISSAHTLSGKEGKKPEQNHSKILELKSGIRVNFDSNNTHKLQELAYDFRCLSGRGFSYKEILKMGLDLLILLVELQKKGGRLVARTADGKEKELIIHQSKTSI